MTKRKRSPKQQQSSKTVAPGKVDASPVGVGEGVVEATKAENLPPIKVRQKDLFAAAGVSRARVKKAGLDWKELGAIYEEHTRLREELEDTANFVAVKLRRLPAIHSVRSRIKDPGHLVEKVVRKTEKDAERAIGFHNYKQQITDRIGIRALHLFKEEWREIHQFVVGEWDLLAEPIAYHRAGDYEEWLAAFSSAGCVVKEHPRNYRSVHYLLRSSGSRAATAVELQVRTVFEEAWSEIDHRINYPASAPYPAVRIFLEIFNRLAGSADEMGTYIHGLTAELTEINARVELAEDERKAALRRIEELIAQLELSTSQRKTLTGQISRLSDDSLTINVSEHGVGAAFLSTGIKFTDVFSTGMDKICQVCGYRRVYKTNEFYFSNSCPQCGSGLL